MTPREDMQRLLALPRASNSSEPCLVPVHPAAAAAGWAWRDCQRDAISAYAEHGGLLAPLGVGSGKTHALLGVATYALRVGGAEHVACFAPPGLVRQVAERFVAAARDAYMPTHVDVVTFSRFTRDELAAWRSSPGGIALVPYSLLQRPNAHELLEALDPQLFLCDEAHVLRNPHCASTRRLLSLADGQRRWAFASGTFAARGVADYAHLACVAFGTRSPAPISAGLRQALDDVVGAGSRPAAPQVRHLDALRDWAQRELPEQGPYTRDVAGVRRAWGARFRSSPGVVATQDERPGASLVMRRVQHEVGVLTHSLMRRLDETWTTPDGDELEDHMHAWRWRYMLASGAYYSLRWPPGSEAGQRAWEAEQRYHAAVRAHLQRSPRPGCDTPALVAQALDTGATIGRLGELRRAWQSLVRPGLPERESVPVRADSSRVDAVELWAADGPGIVWYVHDVVGRWLAERMPKAVLCEAGDVGVQRVLALKGDEVAILSLRAFSEGYNLQAFNRMAFAQWPRNPSRAEQAIGRCHRSGQLADTVEVTWFSGGEWDDLMAAATVQDALHAHQTMAPQRLIYCDWSPPLPAYARGYLEERGLMARSEDDQ